MVNRDNQSYGYAETQRGDEESKKKMIRLVLGMWCVDGCGLCRIDGARRRIIGVRFAGWESAPVEVRKMDRTRAVS